MRPRPAVPLAPLCAAWLCVALPAQGRVFVVDKNNGPGTSFTDLPQALAQAQHGDTYLLRPATYGAASTDKGVALLGTGPNVFIAPQSSAALTVNGLPGGQTFRMRGVGAYTPSLPCLFCPSGAIVLTGCAGSVHLDGVQTVDFLPVPPPPLPLTGIDVADCAGVTLVSCTIGAGIRVARSTLAVSRSTLRGVDATYTAMSSVGHGATTALAANAATVLLSDVVARGGNGSYNFFPPTDFAAQPALVLTGGSAAVAGDATSILTAGTPASGSTRYPSASAVDNQGSMVLDPRVTLQPGGSAAPVTGNAPAVRALSWVRALPAALGGVLQADLWSPPGGAYLLVLGLPAVPTSLPFGTLWVDTNVMVTLAAGVQGPGGTLPTSVPVPMNAALAGAAIAVQAATGMPTTGDTYLSHPAVVVLQ